NPTGEAEGGAMRMGGKAAPFGVDEEALEPLLDQLASCRAIDVRGIHLFAGTQILDHRVLARQYRKGIEIADRVAARLQRPLHTVAFGGGLGIPYFANETELDTDRLGQEVAALMREVRANPRFAGTRFMIEPGRYVVGEAGLYIARVTDVKVSRGKKFVVLDGGMNHHLAASGNLGQVLRRNFPLAVINKLDQRPAQAVDLGVPLCTPLDTLARDITLPRVEVGDLVAIFQSGAYGRSASPLGFLSHPAPPELWIADGRVELVTPRGKHGETI